MFISIIICTYNPEDEIFKRVLTAVKNLKLPELWDFECLIIDNNSSPALEERSLIKEVFSDSNLNYKIIIELNQGLTTSRVTGINLAQGDWIIFVDDDNVIDTDYLVNLKKTIEEYPFVGTWGPGDVTVELGGTVKKNLEGYFKGMFQEKHRRTIEYSYALSPERIPLGSGMIVKREILAFYADGVKNGIFNAQDRFKGNLSSGGDKQIVLVSIKMGWAVGTIPTLRLIHVIPARKCTNKYLVRLGYAVSINKNNNKLEVFPELRDTIPQISQRYFIYSSFLLIVYDLLLLSPWLIIQVKFASYLGETIGNYQIHGLNVPTWMLKLSRFLGYS